MVVVDANVLAYFYIRSEFTEAAEDLRQREPEWVVPTLWRSEFRNVLAAHIRRRRMTLEDAVLLHEAATRLVAGSEHQVDPISVLKLIQQSDCSAYDCEYVALATDLGLRLVTMDRKLLGSFPDRTVPLVSR